MLSVHAFRKEEKNLKYSLIPQSMFKEQINTEDDYFTSFVI